MKTASENLKTKGDFRKGDFGTSPKRDYEGLNRERKSGRVLRWWHDEVLAAGRRRVRDTRLAAANGKAARDGAWRRISLRDRRGWPSLGEAIQIRWSPDETAPADGGGRRRTAADGNGPAGNSSGQCGMVKNNSGYSGIVIQPS